MDNVTVYRKLKAFLIDGPRWAWIEPYDSTENGHEAFIAWCNHYNGQVPKWLIYMDLHKSKPNANASIAFLLWILTALEDVDMVVATLGDVVMDEMDAVAMLVVEDVVDMALIKQ